MADDTSVVNAADDILIGEQRCDARCAAKKAAGSRYRSRRGMSITGGAPGTFPATNTVLDRNEETAAQAPGQKYLPTTTPGGSGTGLTGSADQTALVGQFFLGPYNIGNALRTGGFFDLETEVFLGAAANIVVTGWMLNMITDQPSPLAAFGLVASGAAQIGVGLFFTMAPTKEYVGKQ